MKKSGNGVLLTSLYKKQADDHKRGLSVQRAYWKKKLQQAVKDTAKEIECQIRELFYIPFEGKTEKQKYQRKGMEEGLEMALSIVKGYTGVEVE